VAPAVKRAAEDLSLGFIAPVADGLAPGLVERQDEVMGTIREAVAAQSQALAQAADAILANEPVVDRRFVPLSSAEAVLRYARDFIPSWAGAISIDLLPAVLVLMLAVVHGVLRDASERLPFAERISAAELMMAMDVQRAIDARAPHTPETPTPPAEHEDEGDAVPARPAAAVNPPVRGDEERQEIETEKVTAFAQPVLRPRKDHSS
jgi:hypothetical protein